MKENYWKEDDQSRPLFSLTVGEFIELLQSVLASAGGKEAKVIPLAVADTDVKEVFCIKGLMQFLGCSKASVHNYKRMGLPYFRIGRKVLFNRSDVLEFMRIRRGKRKSLKMAA